MTVTVIAEPLFGPDDDIRIRVNDAKALLGAALFKARPMARISVMLDSGESWAWEPSRDEFLAMMARAGGFVR